MELLKEFFEVDTEEGVVSPEQRFSLRRASRAVIFNDREQVAVIAVTKDRYHKLPGGGMEPGEDAVQALKREVLEETGASMTILGDFGLTIEYRNKHELIQHSYCFYGKTEGLYRIDI